VAYGLLFGCCLQTTSLEAGLQGFASNSIFNVFPSGEIDIMEYRGQETTITQSAMHYGGVWPNNRYISSAKFDTKVDLSAGFHTYALEWDELQARYYLDTTLYWTVNLNVSWCPAGIACPYTKAGQPWDQKFHILLNMAIGGGFFNGYPAWTTNDWTNPNYVVDYVRVYAKNPVGTTGKVTTGTTGTTGKITTGLTTFVLIRLIMSGTTGTTGTTGKITTGTTGTTGIFSNVTWIDTLKEPLGPLELLEKLQQEPLVPQEPQVILVVP
jgi:hypothetical protein